MHFGSISKVSYLCALLLLASGCKQGRRVTPSIGEAYVGPAELKIRSDFPVDSKAVATVKHGERLDIVQRRRSFFKVRTASGAEGWTDGRQLLSSEEMSALRELSERAAHLASQGVAVTYRPVNVHTQPAANSPSFLQIKEKEKVDVLTHVVLPRVDVKRKPLIPPAPKKAKPDAKKPAREPKYPLPPMPKPPPLPDNWLEMSKTEMPDDEDADDPAEPAPVPTDDWSLIRVHGGQAGWVLTRRLSMAIPDEVAQYAEGRRIVSYFSLGKVDEEGQKKDIWLWTTVSGSHPYDFDSFRVFIWSLRHHRYETAYIERNIVGYSPVMLRDVEYSLNSKTGPEKFPGFSICEEKSDGTRHRKEFALLGNIVRYAGERPCEVTAPPVEVVTSPGGGIAAKVPETPAEPAAKPSLWQRMKEKVKGIVKKK